MFLGFCIALSPSLAGLLVFNFSPAFSLIFAVVHAKCWGFVGGVFCINVPNRCSVQPTVKNDPAARNRRLGSGKNVPWPFYGLKIWGEGTSPRAPRFAQIFRGDFSAGIFILAVRVGISILPCLGLIAHLAFMGSNLRLLFSARKLFLIVRGSFCGAVYFYIFTTDACLNLEVLIILTP